MAEARERGGPEEETVDGGGEVAATPEDLFRGFGSEGGSERAERRMEIVVGGTVVTEETAEVADEICGGGEGGAAAPREEKGKGFSEWSEFPCGHRRFSKQPPLSALTNQSPPTGPKWAACLVTWTRH